MKHLYSIKTIMQDLKHGLTRKELIYMLSATKPSTASSKEPKSTCCNADLTIYSGEEGTNFYICSKCNEACGIKPVERELNKTRPTGKIKLPYMPLVPSGMGEWVEQVTDFINK